MAQLQVPANCVARERQDKVELEKAFLGAVSLFERLTSLHSDVGAQSAFRKAFDLVFELHRGQRRPDGSLYVSHPIRVAQTLVNEFNITDLNAVVAALLHDVAEDQALRTNQMLSNSRSDDRLEAVENLSCAVNAEPDKVRAYLQRLTKPDFNDTVVEGEEGCRLVGAQAGQARDLLCLALGARGCSFDSSPDELIRGRSISEVRNLLYLGRWVEILDHDPICRSIKIADFWDNGLNRHELQQQLLDAPLHSEEYRNLLAVSDRLRRKYGAVIELLDRRLMAASISAVPLVNEHADELLRRRITIVKPLYGLDVEVAAYAVEDVFRSSLVLYAASCPRSSHQRES